MNNPVSQLEGLDLFYFQELARELPEPDRTAFLENVQIIAAFDGGATFDLIDPELEAYALANLLQSEYPALNRFSITAEDITSYYSEYFSPPEKNAVEKGVETIISQIKADPERREVTFLGKEYDISKFGFNSAVNNALENSNSKMRLMAAIDHDGKSAILYGRLTDERKLNIGKKEVRLVYMGDIVADIGLSSGHVAVNDGFSTIIVAEDNIRGVLDRRHSVGSNFKHYRSNEYSKLFPHFFGVLGGGNDENLKLMGQLVLTHEFGHFVAVEKFGREVILVSNRLFKEGEGTLFIIGEIYSDLSIIDRILELSKTDIKQAEKAFATWAVFRGENDPNLELNLIEGVISNLLLSVVTFDEMGLHVDWERLAEKNETLKKELGQIMDEVGYNIKFDIVAESGSLQEGDNNNRTKVLSLYNQGVERLIAAVRNQYPDMPIEEAEFVVITHFVNKRLDGKDMIGRPLITTFMGDVIKYQRQLDDWTRKNLGFNDSQVPFKAPEVETITIEDLQKMGLTPEKIKEIFGGE